jgi:addiction module HigA family antidote
LLDLLRRIDLSAAALAKACGTPRTRIERITTEQIGVTADTALRLEKVLETPSHHWLALQRDFDLATTRQKIASELGKIQRLPAATIRRAKRKEVTGFHSSHVH